jgi:hypothetical protein
MSEYERTHLLSAQLDNGLTQRVPRGVSARELRCDTGIAIGFQLSTARTAVVPAELSGAFAFGGFRKIYGTCTRLIR